MFYKDDTRLVAILTDIKGNPIANVTVYFTINKVLYNKTTNANGSASMALNLVPGDYDVSVIFNGTNILLMVLLMQLLILNQLIDASNIVKMYQNDTHFYGTFIGANGKTLANTNVTFNINGVFYTRQTDANGTTRLAINLRPGNYTLTAINPINEEQKGFNVLVKSLIEASDLSKYYQNASKFQATIYNKDGSLAINKDVKFNINGCILHSYY